ncbi:four helix bundle protein [Aneurinibacillus aneurinilyticus]|uniref:TIGR02436 family protein n=1 Tax=Aneurinibacillus aneurinilyticus ATCC 12856 TaxID=649747 RepID=U1X1Q4_ANEAE|nr:four helix bundle protein [Aneurinibacillus aneurinilyticus]ERI08458.1 TIGR02436 family protein [Aneurinibacillus aneurinilyticus ATCC 12856]MED0706451.1 four helix bundle protein [Aneurinibacillus aneurinilyticus]MED0723725.1 four helix bundle protein [Aneurinibacillus aneurinilyticus]MED0730594.1 four helix bundle protein [Aneurinibacillus aneurinilyticus]MED0741077.1 four helix bundle protein [Aneurinibacillus aneurinilyticus]
MQRKSIVYDKAFAFSIRIVKLYQYLQKEKGEYILSKQVLRSGTSIGANIREGLEGQSKKDFIAKLSIALKETAEMEYWLELLIASDIKLGQSLLQDTQALLKLLTSIIRTSKKT